MGIHMHGLDNSFIARYESLDIRIPRTPWGTGLDHASIVHWVN